MPGQDWGDRRSCSGIGGGGGRGGRGGGGRGAEDEHSLAGYQDLEVFLSWMIIELEKRGED